MADLFYKQQLHTFCATCTITHVSSQSNMVLVPYPSNRHHHPAATRPLAWVHTAQRALQDAGPGSTAVDPDRNSDTIEIQGTTQEGEGFGEKHGMGGMGNAHAEQGKGVRQPGMMQEDKGMVHVTVETEHDLSHDAFILHGGVMPNSTNGSDSTDGWGNTSIHNDNNVGSIENADLVQGPIDQHITQQQPVADQQQAPEGTPSEDTTTTVQQQRRRLTQDILGSPSTHPLSSASHPLPAWTPPYLVSMIFAWPFNSLQTAAYEDCDAQPAACRTAAWDRGHPQRVATVVKSAWYCLLLPGDEWSRKQLWDCVADGGIPVVLHGDTLRAMPFREFVPWEDILMVGMSEEQVGFLFAALTWFAADTLSQIVGMVRQSPCVLGAHTDFLCFSNMYHFSNIYHRYWWTWSTLWMQLHSCINGRVWRGPCSGWRPCIVYGTCCSIVAYPVTNAYGGIRCTGQHRRMMHLQ